MDSMQALDHFIEHWRDRPSFLVDLFGNSTFRAQVAYQSPVTNDSHYTVVRIRKHGSDRGKITLRKEPGLFTGFPHTDFLPPRHAYVYDHANHALCVHGYSDKLGGKYQVTITPA
jgi:hypothetical protein